MRVIDLHDVTVRFGTRGEPELDAVSLQVAAGEHVVVAGPLGAGASTLLRLLNGVVPHLVAATVTGRIRVAGLDPLTLPVYAMAGHVGMVLDDPGLTATQGTVAEEVAFGLESLGIPAGAMRPRVATALHDVGLDGLDDRDPATLSGGEQQRLALASVLAMEPSLLVLDEPATNLDPAGAAALLAILRRLCVGRGVTVIRADRDACGATSGATRVVRLAAGRIAADGPPDPDAALGLPAPLGPRSPTGHVVLAVSDVSLTYPGAATPALDGISLEVRAGEVLGMTGPNGSGKSTLARLATGLTQPDAGTVVVGGLDTRVRRPARERAAAAGLVFQDPRHQLLAATVREELALGLRALRTPEPEISRRTALIAERFGLGPLLDRHPLRLGRATRKVVAVAAIRAMAPQLLVLDEPTIGADDALRLLIAQEIVDAAGEGTGVLVLSHDVRLLALVADRVLVVANGRITASGSPGVLLANSLALAGAEAASAPAL